MQGRSEFTPDEIDRLRRLIREKQTADRGQKKSLRAQMRRMGFFISDFSVDYAGFVVSDLDDLIARGTITVRKERTEPASFEPTLSPSELEPTATPPLPVKAGDAPLSWVRDALARLGPGNEQPLPAAERAVEDPPGLYAIYGSSETWRELNLGEPPDS